MNERLLLGINIRNLRTSMGLSQESLSIKTGVPRAYISDVERGKINITLDKIITISNALNVSIAQLFINIQEVDTMNSNLTIYYDSLTEASWFQDLNPIFNNATFEIIKPRGSNPKIIEDITMYDKPDIIVLKDNSPILVLEKTSEVPTGHNVGQRFARLVRAVELGIPTIYYYPFDAKKHGEYAGICNLNIRLLEASFKMLDIHDTPLLSIDWLTDTHGELITDGSENNTLKALLKDYIASNFDKHCTGFKNHMNWMRNEYNTRLRNRPSYAKMPPSVKTYTTKEFCSEFNIQQAPKEFLSRKYTYVYNIGMTPASCKRQDPYTGTQFIYDYILCRYGSSVTEKKANLVLYFPKLNSITWFSKNPNNPNTKSCNWYLTANALLFTDTISFNIK